MSGEFKVGEWLIEPDLNRASRVDCVVQIEPKVLEVLSFLAEHPGEVLSKEKIIQTVWAGTFVSGGILSYSISELRKALGDDAKDPRFIQTISRKGYRLIAPVTRLASNHKMLPSIAILAFCDMSAEKDQEYFCDGIAEEIINNLTRVKGLSVASRTSSFAFKGQSEDVRSIGKKLGVSAVLEGSLRKSGDQLRITAQLIAVEDGYHLWAERYDRRLKDVFAIQDEISLRIAETLKVTLSPAEGGAFGRVPTTDLQAYDYYLRGKQFYYQYKRKSIEFALRMFSHAIELDSRYTRAYAGISDCCAFLYLYAGSHAEHRTQAETSSRIAVDLDPESAEAHASRGVALGLLGNYREAEEALETSVRLGPRLFDGYFFYARVAFVQGKWEKAIGLYEKAAEVQPQDYQSPLLVAQIYEDLGRTQEAESSRRHGIRVAESRLKLNPDDARALYMGANGLVALGEIEKGLEWARLARDLDPNDPMLLYNVACVLSLAGKVEEALDCLEQCVENGLTERRWLERDSNLEPVRGNARYLALIRAMTSPLPPA
jgi:adenylate cyclase